MHEGGSQTYVVKNTPHKRHPEVFTREKLHKSLVSACLSAGSQAGHSDTIASRVVEDVLVWLEDRPEVTSNDLRRVAAKHLKTYHPDASYLYEHHRATI
ncbi:MAG: hypothetical protein WAR37_01820 [Candidatus Microsaccharimonas sp.]